MTAIASPAPARAGLFFVVLFLAAPLLAQSVFDGPPFSADPKALLAAAEKVDAKDLYSIYLLDEATFSFESDGRTRSVWHQIERVVTADGVEEAGTVSAWWSPWYDEKPLIAARVIAKDGTVHMLDPKAIVEATAEQEPDIFSDQRVLRAPLPGVAAGSVIETVITLDGRSPIAGAGKYGRFHFGAGVPLEHSRLTLDAPLSITPRIVNKSGLEPRTVEENGRRRIIFEKAHSDAIEDDETYLPPDQLTVPYVAFSTGTSWHDIAASYAAIVDEQIKGDDLKDMVRKAAGTATDRAAIIARLLDAIRKSVRYAGVEVGDGSIVPRKPNGVLQKGYGDCKDKATLLVAMLRTAGIPAHVALLDSGLGFDTIAELPGANNFNHAIVVVDGEPAMWIDPTDDFARAGELPVEDQGRMALIASDATTALTRTPETPSSANRYVETRTFTLPEEGKARVVEVTEGTATEDANLRRGCANEEKKAYREALERYATRYFVTPKLDNLETTDPHDFARPFRLTLDMAKSKSGVVTDGDGDVAIPIYDLVGYIPSVLRDYEEKTAEAEKAKPEKKRVHDFVFPRPVTREWRYRVVPPAGFTPRTLPEAETTRLGAATLTTEYKIDSDGAVVAKLAFDTGKRRLTAAEFEETRMAVSRLARRPAVHVGFEAAGQAKLTAGDIGGALAEFRKLSVQHPKEAQHHIELARALLAGGLGDAARGEARAAVKIEPASAKAHSMLATTLEHDLLGREYRRGCDIPGAIAALRKAKEVDPSDAALRARLAELLTYGDGDLKFGKNAPLAQAIDEYKSLLKDLGKDAVGWRPPLMLTLAHAGRWDEIRELVKEETDARQRDLFHVMIVTVQEGSAAGLRELGAFEASQRRSYGAAVGQTFMALRRYADAADFFEAATKGSPQAAQTLALVQVLRKTQPYDKLLDGTPRSMPLRLMELLITGDTKTLRANLIPEIAETQDERELTFPLRSLGAGNFSPTVLLDLIGSAVEVQQDGDDEMGIRLRMRSAAGTPSPVPNLACYVMRRDGRYLFAAFSDPPDTIGRAALALADAGKLEAARTWLNWARESISAGGGDDPLEGPPFARLWAKGKAEATADEIRIAAAALASGKDYGAKAIEVLVPLRDKAPTEEAKSAVDIALLIAYRGTRNWDKAAPVAERLAKAHPDSGLALLEWTTALLALGKTNEAETEAKARLARQPKDEHAMRAMIRITAKSGDYDAAAGWARRVVDEITPTRSDYNEAAWVALFRGKELDRAIDDARRATSDEAYASPGALHTLAALYAESGKTVEARQALLKGIDRRHDEEPTSDDWFVLGRIAETYGVRDVALAAYKRVEQARDETGMSTWELVRRRMTAMGIK